MKKKKIAKIIVRAINDCNRKEMAPTSVVYREWLCNCNDSKGIHVLRKKRPLRWVMRHMRKQI